MEHLPDIDKTQPVIHEKLNGDPELNAIIDGVYRKTKELRKNIGRAFNAIIDGKRTAIILTEIRPGKVIGQIPSTGQYVELPMDSADLLNGPENK